MGACRATWKSCSECMAPTGEYHLARNGVLKKSQSDSFAV